MNQELEKARFEAETESIKTGNALQAAFVQSVNVLNKHVEVQTKLQEEQVAQLKAIRPIIDSAVRMYVSLEPAFEVMIDEWLNQFKQEMSEAETVSDGFVHEDDNGEEQVRIDWKSDDATSTLKSIP